AAVAARGRGASCSCDAQEYRGCPWRPGGGGVLMSDELCLLPALELAARIRRRELSPVELLDAVLARVEEVDPRVHAFVTVDAERASAAARAAESAVLAGAWLGALHGLPVSVKAL